MRRINLVLLLLVLFLFNYNLSAQWTRVANLPSWTGAGTVAALGDDFAVFTFSRFQIMFTTDAGKTWTTRNTPQTEDIVDISLASRSTFYIACSSGGFYKTTDAGNSWTPVFSNPSFCSMGDYIEMFGETKGVAFGDGPANSLTTSVFLRTVNGTDWNNYSNTGLGFSGDTFRRVDFINENTGYFFESGIDPQKLLKTTDGGATWKATSFNGYADVLKFYDSNFGLVINANSHSIYKTVNGGTTWTSYAFSGNWGMDIAFIPGDPAKVWSVDTKGLCYSADSGKTWGHQADMANIDKVIFPTAKTGWAYAPGSLYYTGNSAGLINDVEYQNNIPSEFRLEQNYPNPFNPSTQITYSIPVERPFTASGGTSMASLQTVTLKIYDLLGREAAVLVNEPKAPGTYTVDFNPAGKLSSGVYFYRLQAGSLSSVKKMIILK